MSTAYWYLYLTGEGDIQIEFNIGPLNSAVEAGGLIRRSGADDGLSNNVGGAIATDPDALPHSGTQLTSGIGRELSDNGPYAKPCAERTKSPDASSDEKV